MIGFLVVHLFDNFSVLTCAFQQGRALSNVLRHLPLHETCRVSISIEKMNTIEHELAFSSNIGSYVNSVVSNKKQSRIEMHALIIIWFNVAACENAWVGCLGVVFLELYTIDYVHSLSPGFQILWHSFLSLWVTHFIYMINDACTIYNKRKV